jgi:hypothetical protein
MLITLLRLAILYPSHLLDPYAVFLHLVTDHSFRYAEFPGRPRHDPVALPEGVDYLFPFHLPYPALKRTAVLYHASPISKIVPSDNPLFLRTFLLRGIIQYCAIGTILCQMTLIVVFVPSHSRQNHTIDIKTMPVLVLSKICGRNYSENSFHRGASFARASSSTWEIGT